MNTRMVRTEAGLLAIRFQLYPGGRWWEAVQFRNSEGDPPLLWQVNPLSAPIPKYKKWREARNEFLRWVERERGND